MTTQPEPKVTDRLEHEARGLYDKQPDRAIQLSIAISLKRIADVKQPK